MRSPLQVWKENHNPFRELAQMQRSMERLFEDLTPRQSELTTSFNPKCEVTDDKTNYYFKFDLPGVPKDQIKVELNNNVLTVSAERKEEKETNESKKHYVSELFYGSYLRSFTLPNDIDEKKVDAKYEDGVLKLTIPKNGKAQSKQIAVQ